jgi:hypothetical protein
MPFYDVAGLGLIAVNIASALVTDDRYGILHALRWTLLS